MTSASDDQAIVLKLREATAEWFIDTLECGIVNQCHGLQMTKGKFGKKTRVHHLSNQNKQQPKTLKLL
jgi:hypothetical protein